jgi:hypothetical protein
MSSELALGISLVGLLLASNVAFAVAWTRARRRAAALELAQADGAEVGVSFDAPRSRRLEETIEAMALEIERIGEGQRFTSRLLAESRRIAPRHAMRRPDPGAAH